MKKRLFTAALIVLVAALTLGCFTACYGDADYFADLAEYGFWANDPEEAIAQPKIGQLVRDFLDSPLPDGKSEQTMRGYEFSCPCLLYEKRASRSKGGGSKSLFSSRRESVLKSQKREVAFC